jgi:hypothetical protein
MMNQQPSITASGKRDGTYTIYLNGKVFEAGISKDQIVSKGEEAIQRWKEKISKVLICVKL